MKFLTTILSNAKGYKATLRLAAGTVASSSVKLLGRMLMKAKNHKPALIIAGIAVAGSAIAVTFYINRALKVRTYSIAYIGRYQKEQFDLLHELALRKYMDELNAPSHMVIEATRRRSWLEYQTVGDG